MKTNENTETVNIVIVCGDFVYFSCENKVFIVTGLVILISANHRKHNHH